MITKRADERCCSVRRSRVVLTPRRWRQVRGVKSAQPGLDKTYPRATVANKPGHRGARRKPLKPLRAGTSGDSGVLVYSCAFYQYQVHTRPRVQRASGVPHDLLGRKIHQRLGRMARRGREIAFEIRVTSLRRQAAIQTPSFRGDAQHRTRNLEIPGLRLTAHPGMTAMDLLAEPVIAPIHVARFPPYGATSSTRRLSARPASEALEPIGASRPTPAVRSRGWAMR